MDVCIAFERDPGRNPPKHLARALGGAQVRAELLVGGTTYCAHLHCCFEERAYRQAHYSSRTHDLSRIPGLSSEDASRIARTCAACIRKRVPYNARDMVLAGTMAPTFFDNPQPEPPDVFAADSLFCAQSVVLILRACLPPAHPLAQALAATNSRSVTPHSLCALVQPLCVRISSVHGG